jgi:ABC-type thiamine transport system substrate-binding protein
MQIEMDAWLRDQLQQRLHQRFFSFIVGLAAQAAIVAAVADRRRKNFCIAAQGRLQQ